MRGLKDRVVIVTGGLGDLGYASAVRLVEEGCRVALFDLKPDTDGRAAGLDVFETEPLPPDYPLRESLYALLTSHTAWYSEASLPRLAAEEALRGLRGEPLKNQVNT